MRLWSLHPKYLDRQGLLAVWREGLLAQKVLSQGKYKKCPLCLDGKWITGKFGYNQYITCPKCKGTGKIKTPYYNHPQLDRFKKKYPDSLLYLGKYLYVVLEEAERRGYKFNGNLVKEVSDFKIKEVIIVTIKQLEYEFKILQKRLKIRSPDKWKENAILFSNSFGEIEYHPLFKVVEGGIESWEKVKG